jgi:phosphoglycolate phosphatase-like HAD superfamily hydrolase
MQMFHWTRNPAQAAKIAQRKEEIYDSIMNGVQPAEVPGVRSYLDTLRNYNVSAGVLSSCNSGVALLLCRH